MQQTVPLTTFATPRIQALGNYRTNALIARRFQAQTTTRKYACSAPLSAELAVLEHRARRHAQ